MKKILSPVLAILLATLFLAVLPTEAVAGIYEDTIRIHILANSDSDDDQKIKIWVRDKLLEKYSSLFADTENVREAEKLLSEKLPEIEADICEWVSEYGITATARLDTEWFDTRYYENFSLPAGEYLSLIVEIGEGEGKNWWCVMYPPMCLDVATKSAGSYSSEEENLILGKYRVKFKLLELISGSLRKN